MMIADRVQTTLKTSVKRLRREHNISQQQMASMVGISLSGYKKKESLREDGSDISLKDLLKLAGILNFKIVISSEMKNPVVSVMEQNDLTTIEKISNLRSPIKERLVGLIEVLAD